MLRKYLLSLIESAAVENEINIINFIPQLNNCTYLDLGCDDGKKSLLRAQKAHARKILGIEIIRSQAIKARNKGIKVFETDLNFRLPISSCIIDLITCNQVIEHLYDIDVFLSEIYRTLKKQGVLILSTENLSSWHNIFSLVFGFQPFSMTNISRKGNIGNPFSLWKNPDLLHKCLFSYFGIKDLLHKHGFMIECIKTSGYYPLPNFFAHFDKIHGHWLTIKARKK